MPDHRRAFSIQCLLIREGRNGKGTYWDYVTSKVTYTDKSVISKINRTKSELAEKKGGLT